MAKEAKKDPQELTVEQKLKALFQLQTMLSKIDEIKTLSCYKTDCFLFLLSWVNIEIAVKHSRGYVVGQCALYDGRRTGSAVRM